MLSIVNSESLFFRSEKFFPENSAIVVLISWSFKDEYIPIKFFASGLFSSSLLLSGNARLSVFAFLILLII